MLPLLYAALYGFTMKVADLLDEHGLRLFKGSALVFGALWGFFGALLVLTDPVIANIVLAMNIAFILRLRLDYLNHALAASIIIVAFLLTASIQPVLFLAFYLAFIAFGSLKDVLDDVFKRKGFFKKLSETMWYYPVSTLIYGLITNNFFPFAVLTVFTVSYDLTKLYFAKKKGLK